MSPVTSPQIIQIGAVPPPYGGVSVHLSRLMARLRAEALPCQLIDISGVTKSQADVRCLSWRSAFLNLLRHEMAIVHFHNFAPRNLYLYSILATRHRTILSFHNERFASEIQKYSDFEQALFVRLLDNFDAIVVDSNDNHKRALDLGVNVTKLQLIPEFLPPQVDDSSSHLSPPEINELRAKHKFLLATNAFSLVFHRGEDMYGIDLIIELMGKLVNESKLDVAAVIVLPNPDNPDYFAKLKSRVGELSLQDRCLILTKALEDASSLWKSCDVVIRATNTDGNSMSILEALACGTPVIASDCVERHPATRLFKNRSVESLTLTTLDVLEHLDQIREITRTLQLEDNGVKFIDLYRNLAGAIKLD